MTTEEQSDQINSLDHSLTLRLILFATLGCFGLVVAAICFGLNAWCVPFVFGALILGWFGRDLLSQPKAPIEQADSKEPEMEVARELQQILDFTPLALIYADANRKIARTNPAFEKLFGYTQKEVFSLPTQLVYADYDDFVKQGKKRYNLSAECKLKPYEVEYRRKDGTTFIGETVGSATKNSQGETIAFLGLVQDVTERIKSHQMTVDAKIAAEESEKRFRNLADSASPLCWVTEPDSTCSWVNRRWVTYTGKKLADQCGDGWLDSIHPEDREHTKWIYESSMETHSEFSIDYRLRRCDGAYRWFTANGTPRFDERGRFLGYVGMSFDTHEIREHRIALEKSKAELETANGRLTQSNAELERFAYAASHDLQEPLRKLNSFCELLNEECGETVSDDGKEYLKYIMDGATRMRSLIHGILEFSRVRVEDREVEKLNGNELFDEAFINFERVDGEITRGELPTISVDRHRFERLLSNLIGNAVKYCQVRPQIHLDCKTLQNEYVFSVRDNGIGILPQFHKDVFDLFKRLHNRSVYSGSGIGLAICERIVNQWNGRIWVESSGENGSVFYFTCPIETADEVEGDKSVDQTQHDAPVLSLPVATVGVEPTITKV